MDFLDAPCTGSKAGAENGTLTFMVAGEKNVFDRARAWFEPMGHNSTTVVLLVKVSMRSSLTEHDSR